MKNAAGPRGLCGFGRACADFFRGRALSPFSSFRPSSHLSRLLGALPHVVSPRPAPVIIVRLTVCGLSASFRLAALPKAVLTFLVFAEASSLPLRPLILAGAVAGLATA